MNRLHIVGGKNHGKTTLIVDLVREFAWREAPVGTIKHTHHRHELDVPGKDSYRHRTAGAKAVGILSPEMCAVFLPVGETVTAPSDRYSALVPMFAGCRLVLVEGDSQATAPKIEVWRNALRTPPLAKTDRSIGALVTDDAPPTDTHLLARRDISALADWILAMT